jgi:hypothetical protein
MKINVNDIDFKSYNAKNLGYKKKPKEDKQTKFSNTSMEDDDNNMLLLETCINYWNALSDFRSRRKTNILYYTGDQWHELMEDPETGETVTEEDYIMSQGKVPFKQNMLRQLGKNILGQYRSNQGKVMIVARDRSNTQVSEVMTETLQSVYDLNEIKELDTRNLEEFMLSGGAISKITMDYYPEKDKYDLLVENVNMNRIFFNSDIEDLRLRNLHTIGEIIDMSVDDVIAAFASNEAEGEEIRDHYQIPKDDYQITNGRGLSEDRLQSMSFLITDDLNHCRVIEVWQKKGKWTRLVHDYLDGTYTVSDVSMKEIEAANQQRIQMALQSNIPIEDVPLIDAKEHYEEVWYVKYLTPYGKCLYESETPYAHQSHPYAVLLYPLVDGKVWGVIADVIDQQRYINRLISLLDFIMGASAKGVLLVPEEVIPVDMTIDDFAAEWSKFNGVIKYRSKPGVDKPSQVAVNSTNIGAHELLAMQLNLIEKIIGVSGAVQGHQAKSGTPSSLYAQEAQNSTINSLDMFESFATFRKRRDMKIVKNIIQFYNEPRSLPQKTSNSKGMYYDPELVKDVEFDLVIAQGADTPVYRQMIEETLFKLLEGQLIDVKTYLTNSSLPYADKLLSSILQRESEMQQQAMQQIPPEMMQQIGAVQQQAQQQANPQAMNMMNKMMQGM